MTGYNLTTSELDRRDPHTLNWTERRKNALIPFGLDADGLPLNPVEPRLPAGRGELWHWGEAVAADAIVFTLNQAGERHLLIIERDDNHGFALPGGGLDRNEQPEDAVARELKEETGLVLDVRFKMQQPRYVPDPRAGRHAWMVTVPGIAVLRTDTPPAVTGADDARRALWLRADRYRDLERAVRERRGSVFAAHQPMLKQILG